ncbi:PAX3_7 [Lepeophtheirus salmonis]|uniref:PAX3_7 n=1 Tax=Lepeophtheirus salmonis TaxID=72036 RepID=A0A817FE18_LEPSM|nr:PAX3_7 [Lepeophtheirus salmonis]CAG9478306.1 PAX3_7 [Lepeophtheirus salmonis]
MGALIDLSSRSYIFWKLCPAIDGGILRTNVPAFFVDTDAFSPSHVWLSADTTFLERQARTANHLPERFQETEWAAPKAQSCVPKKVWRPTKIPSEIHQSSIPSAPSAARVKKVIPVKKTNRKETIDNLFETGIITPPSRHGISSSFLSGNFRRNFSGATNFFQGTRGKIFLRVDEQKGWKRHFNVGMRGSCFSVRFPDTKPT